MEYFSHRNTLFAQLEWKGVQGMRGLGFYGLLLEVGVTLSPRPENQSILLSVSGGALSARRTDRTEWTIGAVRVHGAPRPLETPTGNNASTTGVYLELELDASRLAAIEDFRAGQDLGLSLRLWGEAARVGDPKSETVQAELSFLANQSTWIAVLDRMGYRKTMLIEVPLVSGEVSAHFPEAYGHLAQAHKQLLLGHFRDAVGGCRDVLDALSLAADEERDQLPTAIAAWFRDTKELSKEQRMRLIRRALKVLTHAARHADEITQQMEWGPEDARAALAISAAILRLASEQRQP